MTNAGNLLTIKANSIAHPKASCVCCSKFPYIKACWVASKSEEGSFLKMAIKNGTPVSINLQTKVTQQGQTQDFFFDIEGQIVTIGDTLYIRYEELQENGESIPVTIKVMPDGGVQLTRSGEMRLKLKFVYRETVKTSYRTPYGEMVFGTYTRNLHVSLKDRPTSGKILIEYDLFMADELVGNYLIDLAFTA